MAIFKHNEEELLQQDNSIKIFNKLRTMAQGAVDVNKLTQVKRKRKRGWEEREHF